MPKTTPLDAYIQHDKCECFQWGSTDPLGRPKGYHHPRCPIGSAKVIGYVLLRPATDSAWMYAGETPDEVAATLRCEIEPDCDGLSIDEREKIVIEPREFTRDEIENMPDFDGW